MLEGFFEAAHVDVIALILAALTAWTGHETQRWAKAVGIGDAAPTPLPTLTRLAGTLFWVGFLGLMVFLVSWQAALVLAVVALAGSIAVLALVSLALVGLSRRTDHPAVWRAAALAFWPLAVLLAWRVFAG